MPETDEDAALDRLAQVHAAWRSRQPPSPREQAPALTARAFEAVLQPKPNLEIIRLTRADPLRATIHFRLSVIGWQLYARGGTDLLTATVLRIERDRHPAFASAVHAAWRGIGAADTEAGVWDPMLLLDRDPEP